MANQLSPALINQIFSQESNDPFLALLTLNHDTFDNPIYLVNNSVDIVSNGITYTAFPFIITLPADDGETARNFKIEFDNVSLLLIEEIRSVTTPIQVKIEMILASMPDDIQMSQDELKIQNVTYNKQRVVATIIMDTFLTTEITSERYGPTNFKGLF